MNEFNGEFEDEDEEVTLNLDSESYKNGFAHGSDVDAPQDEIASQNIEYKTGYLDGYLSSQSASVLANSIESGILAGEDGEWSRKYDLSKKRGEEYDGGFRYNGEEKEIFMKAFKDENHDEDD